MRKLFITLCVTVLSFTMYAQHAVEAGLDMISVCGSPVTLKATGYKGWAQIQTSPFIQPLSLSAVKFITEDIGFVCGNNNVYKTADRGLGWNMVYVPASNNTFYCIHFVNQLTGFIGGGLGVILKTTDGGNTWAPIATDGSATIQSIWFITDKTGFAVGSNGVLFKTTDGGSTWVKTVINSSQSYYSIVFTSTSNGFIACSGGVVLRTIDGGATWSQKSLGSSSIALYSLSFPTTTNGYVCGGSGNIFRTTDGGDNWEKYSADSIFTEDSPTFKGKLLSATHYKSVCFVSADTGYVGGYYLSKGFFAKTTDGGQHWYELNNKANFKMNAMTITSKPNVGYAVSSQGRIAMYYDKPTLNGLVDRHWTAMNNLETLYRDTLEVSPSQNTTYKYSAMTQMGTLLEDSMTVYVQPLQLTSTVKYTQAVGGLVKIDNYKTNYTGTDKFTYKWTPSTGLSSDTAQFPLLTMNTELAQYNLTVSSPGGCSASCSVTIKDSLTVKAEALNVVVCEGNVQLNAVSNYAGNGNLRYKWTPATGLNNDTIANPMATISSTQIYTVKLTTPEGKTATSEVMAKSVPFTVNAGVDKSVKCGSPITITATTNYDNNILKFKWTPSTGLSNDTILNPIVTVNTTTTYRLTATTSKGCTSFDDVVITPVAYTVNAGADKTVIAGNWVKLDSVTVTTINPNIKYKWTPSAGLSNDTIPNPVAGPSTTTTYTVNVSTPSGCSYSDNVLVTVTPFTFDLGSNKTMSCGTNTQLNIVTTSSVIPVGSKYKWSPSLGLSNDTIPNPVATPSVNTTYTLSITTPSGCIFTDNITVSVVALTKPNIAKVEISADNKNVIYWNLPSLGKVISFNIFKETNITDNYNKIGSVNATATLIFKDTLSHPDIQSNKYKISLIDECGFESEMSPYHKTMHLTINKGVGSIWNLIWEPYEGFTVSTYNIYRGTTKQDIQIIGSLSGSNTQFSDYTAPSGYVYYQVEAVASVASGVKSQNIIQKTENEGLANITSRSNIATNNSGIDGIYDIENESELISVYPNPAFGTISVDVNIDITDDTNMNIYNSLGQLITKKRLQSTTQKFDISDLSKGIYFIEVNNETQSGRIRLMVK